MITIFRLKSFTMSSTNNDTILTHRINASLIKTKQTNSKLGVKYNNID